MATTIIFFIILYLASDIMNSFSNDAILLFLGFFMLSFANEIKK